MEEQRWEYCELGLVEWTTKEKKSRANVFAPLQKETTRAYECYLRYYIPVGGEIRRSLGELGTPLQLNPFVEAMGLLGSNGWELVSVQHGNRYGGGPMPGFDNGIMWDNRVAYFKRPIVPGRAVDEPKLGF